MPSVKRAKTESEPKGLLLTFIAVVIAAVSALSLAFLIAMAPGIKNSVKNCDNPATKSEVFHCNITELEYVVEPAQRELGLSGREKLDGNQAMLFVFENTAKQCIWMKDMKFNIDIAWLDENKKVIKMLKDVSPDTYPESFCANDTRYVLEVNSGAMDRLGIGVGDSIQL